MEMRHRGLFLRSRRALLIACSAPAVAFFAAFSLLPAVLLVALPAETGWATYVVTLTDEIYLRSLLQTLALASAVTVVTLVVGSMVGVGLAKARFKGRALLLSLLTLPLSFAGVIIGFFIILLGGRQGLLADLTAAFGGERITFAYGLLGLFLGYMYFSLPRAIASYTAAAEAMNAHIEEAVRSLGGGTWPVIRDAWLPQLFPTTMACGAIVFASAMGAFGTAFTLSSKYEVLPITIYNEFTNYANFALAASLSITLGLLTWLVLWVASRVSGTSAVGV